MFSLSKINISVLQASLVEETISFAALDHIRELTCVSTLAVCLDNITCQVSISGILYKETLAIASLNGSKKFMQDTSV